jgi:hypothetical protein
VLGGSAAEGAGDPSRSNPTLPRQWPQHSLYHHLDAFINPNTDRDSAKETSCPSLTGEELSESIVVGDVP